MLDENLLATPEIAIGQADKAVILLSETVGKAFSTASAIRQDPELAHEVDILCERSHRYQEQIDAYLTRISSGELGKKERAAVSLLSTGNIAFGRMGKTAQRILSLGKETYSRKIQISEESRREILYGGDHGARRYCKETVHPPDSRGRRTKKRDHALHGYLLCRRATD